MENSFTIWECNELPTISNLILNTKYGLDKKIDDVTSFIYDTAMFHLGKKDIIFDENKYTIEFSLETETQKFSIEYNRKTKSYPELTVIIFLEEIKYNPLILTNIDLDSYKYKDIKTENNFYCIIPEKNTQIVFDSSKYYGFYMTSENKFLKINVRGKVTDKIDIYIPIEENAEKNKYEFKIIPRRLEEKEKTVVYKNMVGILLYEDNKNIDMLDKIFSETCSGLIKIINTTQNFVDLEYLQENFGELAQDLFLYINLQTDICDISGNRFANNKIITNVLSKDVCYWIINESEKIDWETSKYTNFPTYLTLDKIPSVLNFILFISNYWFTEIKKMFQCETLNFNIVDAFVSKYTKCEIDNIKTKDNVFLTLSIALNDELDYKEGAIVFDDVDEKIIIHQGDMLIYTGKKSRTKGSVSDGVKYILVLLIEIIL